MSWLLEALNKPPVLRTATDKLVLNVGVGVVALLLMALIYALQWLCERLRRQ